MRVVIVKYEDRLLPLIASEEETVGDLIQQWQKNSRETATFAVRLVDAADEAFIPAPTLVSALPLPRPGYSSIELSAHRVASLSVSLLPSTFLPVSLPLSASLRQLEAASLEAAACPSRQLCFHKAGKPLSGPGSLAELGVADGDSLTAEAWIHLEISRLGGDGEAARVSCRLPLRQFFAEDERVADQRFYDSMGRQVNAEEASGKALGLQAGVSEAEPVRLLFVRRMGIRVRTPPLSKAGFVDPDEQLVSVWPHKPVACLVPPEKALLGMCVFFQGRALPLSTTFWKAGVGPGQLLFLDKRMALTLLEGERRSALELRRSARLSDLLAAVRRRERCCSAGELFVAGKPLSGPQSALLRHCGVRDGGEVELRPRQIAVSLLHEDHVLPAGSLPVGASFTALLQRAQEVVGCELGANCFFQCACGRRLASEPESGQAELAEACCSASPRLLTLHRVVNVKVVEDGRKARHLLLPAAATLHEVLLALQETGARLCLAGQATEGGERLRDCQLYLGNRVQFQLERRILVGVRTAERLLVRHVWPSGALGLLVRGLMADGAVAPGRRVTVTLNGAQLASYGGPTVAVSQKRLSEYGIVDGSVLDVSVEDEESSDKSESQGEVAQFLIVCNKWKVENFTITVSAPPTIRSVFEQVANKLKGTKRQGVPPILAQVQAKNGSGDLLLFAAVNRWVNEAGEVEKPAFSPKFDRLSSPVQFVPGVATKIHVRGWRDGSA